MGNIAADKILNRKRSALNPAHEVWDGEKLYRYACRTTGEVPLAEKTASSNIKEKRSWAWMSQISDRAVEEMLDKGLYTMDHMLVIHDPYRYAPLTAILVFNTEKACAVRVSVQDEFGFTHTGQTGTRHRIPVFALRAGMENKVLVELLDGDTVIRSTEITLLTGALPKLLENMVETKIRKKESALRLIFIYGGDTRFPYAFDERGEIRYYLAYPPKAYGLFPMSEGRFLFLVNNISAPAFANPHSVVGYEMDLLGRTYHEYYVEDGIHHDGCEMTPGGNILTVSSSMEKYVEDAIIEIDRQTGNVVKKFGLADVLSDHPYFDMFDWAHINTVSYLPEDHSICICARNLHSLIKIDWETYELKWIICDPAFWEGTPYADKVLKPMPGMEYFYQAHAGYMLGEKTKDGRDKMIIFDNHWHARRPVETFDGDKFSYVRIYAIDEENGTVELLKSYKSRKSKIRSNGIIVGKRVFGMSGYLNKPLDGYEGIINEYSRKTGKVLNRYLTYNSFYRGYPFFADYTAYEKPMPQGGRPMLGTEGAIFACEPVNLAEAKHMPFIRIPFYKKNTRKQVRKEVRSKEWKENRPQYSLNRDLGEIYLRMNDELLLLFNRDHVIEKVFFCGKNHTFCKDFSNTTQRSPQLFEDNRYFIAVPTGELEPDDYEICIQCRGGLYRTGRHISKKQADR